MTILSSPAHAAGLIQARLPDFTPRVGIILGSGLGGLADQISSATYISYEDLPGFPKPHVAGHAGNLVLGHLNGTAIACLQGRTHLYEGFNSQDVKMLVRTLKLLGCETLLITNASGSLREDVGPGELMLITDHINFQGCNPLVGPNEDEFGPRFFAMDDAYDKDLRERMLFCAKQLDIALAEGVYISVLGPSFETAAEIRAFRLWGADAVGMSTVPEVLVARHCGLKVVVVATITNYATGMSDEKLSHAHTLHYAHIGAKNLSRLVNQFVGSFKDDA